MGKNKFDILNDEDSKNVVAAAALKENKTSEKKELVNINLTAFPKELHEALKANKSVTGETAVGFIKRATNKLAREEGII